MSKPKTSYIKILIIAALAFLIVRYINRDKGEEVKTLVDTTIEQEMTVVEMEQALEGMDVESIGQLINDLDDEDNNNVDLDTEDDLVELSILSLTNEDLVVDYVRVHKKLPEYYITKSEARKLGWIAARGNLCEVLPGKAIGGDYFGNYEGNLPKAKGRKYYEADINYDCGRRDAQRLVYSNDGLIFITKDHYKTFVKK